MVIFELIVMLSIFQLIHYTTRKGYILADYLRNFNASATMVDALDMDSVLNVYQVGKEFYLSHTDLYERFLSDDDSIYEDYRHFVKECPGFAGLSDDLYNLTVDMGVDTVRLVMVDYTNGTLFTFLSTGYGIKKTEGMWLDRKTGIKPNEQTPGELFAHSEWSILKNNRSSYGNVTSVPYRLTFDDDTYVVYMFLDTDEIFSGEISGYYIKGTVIGMTIAIFVIGILIFLLMNREIIEPLNSLSEATGSLITNLGDENDRDYVYRKINIDTGDEIEHLYHSVQIMEEGIYHYMDELKEATSEKERLRTELYIAESIQKNMLPVARPDFSDRPCFDIAASMHPAKEVGGDFYDFFMLSEDRLAFLIADVSGKGVPAALVMAIGKSMLKNYTKETGNISEAFRNVNNLLLDTNNDSMFITAFEAILDLRTGEMDYVNAGHEDPFVKRADGEFVLRKEKHAIVLGAMENIRYKTNRMELHPGDRIYIYTDGVPEAQDHDYQMFGLKGASEALNSVRDKSAEEVIEAVRQSVHIFVKNEPQFDDMTMLCLDFKEYYRD